MTRMNRRSLIKFLLAGAVGAIDLRATARLDAHAELTKTLKAEANAGELLVATFSGEHELTMEALAAKIIATEFNMLSVGNDLKMNRVHPLPDAYDFSYGDSDLDWSKRNNLLFRGHTLIWHNALPSWFRSCVSADNAERVMTDHITTVMKHYAGTIYSWDVVNEPIRNIDGRSDGLRNWPWLMTVGSDYIDIAFHAAAAADPLAKLILNENNVEHDLPLHAQRRATLLQLVTRLKRNNVPVNMIGIQGHIRADTPLATSELPALLSRIRSLGFDVAITELDVDDSGIAEPDVDEAVARRYAEFLALVAPFVSFISFQQLADGESYLPKRSDGFMHRTNLFDQNYQKTDAYYAVAKTFKAILPH
jgi:endo-1,4-beta-xylanase